MPRLRRRRRGPVPLLLTVLLLAGCAAGEEQDAAVSPAASTPTNAAATPEAATPGTATATPGATAAPTPTPTPAPASAPATSAVPAFDGTVIDITNAGGTVTTPAKRVQVALGSRVRLVATSDVQEEIHVHGVNDYVDLQAGQTTTHDFTASIPGTFEIELHGSGDLILNLTVQPA